MRYIVENLVETLRVRQSSKSVSRDVFVFHKCKNNEGLGDFACVVSHGEIEDLTDDLVKSLKGFEALADAQLTVVENRVYISLNRTLIFSCGLRELFSCAGGYGINHLFEGKFVSILVDSSQDEDSATSWRIRKAEEILRRVIKCCGASDTTDGAELLNVIVNNRSRGVSNGATMVLVGGVVCKNGSESSSALHCCERAILAELTQMGETRLDDENSMSDNSLDIMAQMSLIFALFNGNLSKNVALPLKSLSPICRAAVFVLYNYCRMTHIVHKFKKLEKDGTYPPLPEISSVDFSLLTSSEEWDLMLNFIIYWPNVVRSTVTELGAGEFKLHKIVDFLKCLASKFSAYYRRNRILTDSRPHLLPVLFARMFLILGLMDVYKNALDLLGVQPIQNM